MADCLTFLAHMCPEVVDMCVFRYLLEQSAMMLEVLLCLWMKKPKG